jgi:hypothetical protein
MVDIWQDNTNMLQYKRRQMPCEAAFKKSARQIAGITAAHMLCEADRIIANAVFHRKTDTKPQSKFCAVFSTLLDF